MADHLMPSAGEPAGARPAQRQADSPASPRKYARAIDCTSCARSAPPIEPARPGPEPALPAAVKAMVNGR